MAKKRGNKHTKHNKTHKKHKTKSHCAV